MKRTRHYYGIEHIYGATVGGFAGCDIGVYRAFIFKMERDIWVRDGGDFVSQPGYREPITIKRMLYNRIDPRAVIEWEKEA